MQFFFTVILLGYKEPTIRGALEISMYLLIDATEPRNKTLNALFVCKETKQPFARTKLYSRDVQRNNCCAPTLLLPAYFQFTYEYHALMLL
jgi:hypothetical protein